MKIGAVYPQVELDGDPKAFDAIGRSAEALGYDYFLMFDHVIGAVHENRNPPLPPLYNEKDPFHDPLVAFAYMAGITKRIELMTGILILPQRQTLLVARQAADVDLLSGERLRLGVGSGWNYVEYDALGQDFRVRGPRLGEQIVLLRRLWGEAPLHFEGKFDRIDRASLNPRPKRPIPIYCGGSSAPAFQRAAKLADGFIFSGSLEKITSGWRKLKELLVNEGRSVEGFGADYLLPHGLNVQTTLDTIRRWQDAGGTHAAVRTMGLGFTTPQQHIDYFAEVRDGLKF